MVSSRDIWIFSWSRENYIQKFEMMRRKLMLATRRKLDIDRLLCLACTKSSSMAGITEAPFQTLPNKKKEEKIFCEYNLYRILDRLTSHPLLDGVWIESKWGFMSVSWHGIQCKIYLVNITQKVKKKTKIKRNPKNLEKVTVVMHTHILEFHNWTCTVTWPCIFISREKKKASKKPRQKAPIIF